MDRPRSHYGYLAVLLTLAAAVFPATSGCRSALATAMFLVKGTNIDAEYEGLKGKKVVVVCRPLASLTYRNSNVAKDLAREVSRLLRSNVSKIKVIDQRQVSEWTDANTWDEYSEIGEALEAEMVVAIDLRGFTIYEGQTLYQGKADVTLRVLDCTQDGEVVFERDLPRMVYPPNAVIEASERPEREFRREYLRILADHIGRHFYPHDAHADYALDATALD